jgi:transposase
LGVSKVRRAYQLAITSIGVSEGLQAMQLAIQLHLAHLQVLQTQWAQVTQAMTTCLASLSETPYLLSVKSMKAISVALFLAEVGDPRRYQLADQWVKLAGIQPAPNTSGKKQRLRTLLYFTCLRMIRSDPHFAQLYSALQRRPKNPLAKMQAIGVLMNKLLHILWALIHYQTFYDPSFASSI